MRNFNKHYVCLPVTRKRHNHPKSVIKNKNPSKSVIKNKNPFIQEFHLNWEICLEKIDPIISDYLYETDLYNTYTQRFTSFCY